MTEPPRVWVLGSGKRKRRGGGGSGTVGLGKRNRIQCTVGTNICSFSLILNYNLLN